jgi:8-amino-7-oxononanoate synthase
LINFARPFIYSTAPAPTHVLALQRTLTYITEAVEERQKLKNRIRYFKSLQKSPSWGESETAIQTYFVSGNEAVRALAAKVQAAGFGVKPIVYPTVPKGKERIRITLNADSLHYQIELIIQLLESNA